MKRERGGRGGSGWEPWVWLKACGYRAGPVPGRRTLEEVQTPLALRRG